MLDDHVRQRNEYLDACALLAMDALIRTGKTPKGWGNGASWNESLAADAYDIARAMYAESMKVAP